MRNIELVKKKSAKGTEKQRSKWRGENGSKGTLGGYHSSRRRKRGVGGSADGEKGKRKSSNKGQK